MRDQAWKSEKADNVREMDLSQEERGGCNDWSRGGNGGDDDDSGKGEKAQPNTVPAQGKKEGAGLFGDGCGRYALS